MESLTHLRASSTKVFKTQEKKACRILGAKNLKSSILPRFFNLLNLSSSLMGGVGIAPNSYSKEVAGFAYECDDGLCPAGDLNRMRHFSFLRVG